MNIARNLMKLVETATPNEMACMEEFINLVKDRPVLPKVFYELSDIYTEAIKLRGNESYKSEKPRVAFQLIRIIGFHLPKLLLGRRVTIYDAMSDFLSKGKPDFIQIKESMIIYKRLITFKL